MDEIVINISNSTPEELEELFSIIEKTSTMTIEDAGEVYADRKYWSYYKLFDDGVWCSIIMAINEPEVTIKEYLKKYGKPKYSLGDLYLR